MLAIPEIKKRITYIQILVEYQTNISDYYYPPLAK